MSEREKRLATNEALFREMNERVEDRVQAASGKEATLTIVCECADPDCTERISLTVAEYESAHGDSGQFTIVPGHAAVEVEEVVTSNERFEVVRKRGFAADVADAVERS